MENQMITTNLLNEKQKKEAAQILYDAFKLKFIHAWLHNKSEGKTFLFLEEGLSFEYGIFAIQNERVIGLLGLDLGKGKRFLNFPFHTFLSTYGFLGGIIRYLIHFLETIFINSPANKMQSRVYPLAVSPDYRGKGVGSKLLTAFEEHSKELRNKTIALEVVDTNPRAKMLYEKEGYITKKYIWTAIFTKKAGFNGLYYMKKQL